MSASTDRSTPTPTLTPGETSHGFHISQVTPLPDIGCVAYIAEHPVSGARLLHLHADDEENLFAIGLRTPPADDTGIAHILEHSVLCGSERYPVKDPFVELLKSSLATFLNAMTYPDRTVYPCASMNRRDFFNLASVYCDAVYHPMLREDHFKQEGHRLGFEPTGDPEGKLAIKGIVYNEMKGAYSDFNGTLFRATKTGICPDNTYGCDSGGRPDAIPQLSYQQFCEFHRTLYHPANSFVFAYGDVPTSELCAFMDQRLAGFSAIEVDTTIAEQPRWSEPVRRTVPYPVGADEDTAGKTAVTMTWLTCPVTDTLEWLAMQVLSGYLLDNDASPLRRALIASGLGKGLAPSGYIDSMRDTAFTVGLKGTEVAQAEAIEAVIRDCLAAQADGLDAELLEAAFHQLELEVSDVPGQYPLQLMGRAYQRWLYGADPLEAVDLLPQLARLRARHVDDPSFFPGLLRRYVVDNPHCLVQCFVPDGGYNARNASEEQARVDAIADGLSAEQRAAIAQEDTRLEAAQGAPNSAEALATLPRLSLSDVPSQGSEPAVQCSAQGDAQVLRTEVLSAGVTHLTLAYDLSGLDPELVDYLPLYADVLSRLGAGARGWEQLAREQDLIMSGVGVGSQCSAMVGDPLRAGFHLSVSSAALHRNVPAMLDILGNRVLDLRLDEHDRLKELIHERRAQLRNGVIPNGSGYASLYAGRGLSRANALGERKGGFTQIRFFEALDSELDQRFDAVLAALTAIREHLAGCAALTASVVGDDTAAAAVQAFASGFADRGSFGAIDNAVADAAPTHDGIATAADVAYVARVAPVGALDDAEAAALGLLAAQLRVGFLWEEVRVKGGAYGARTSYDRQAGTFSVASYRDPHIAQTLATYQRIVPHVLSDMDLSPEGLEQAVIGTMKTLDHPLRPGQAMSQALVRVLRGSTAASRQAFRSALLGLDATTVKRVAQEVLAPALSAGPSCVLSSREKLEAATLDQVLSISDL